MPNNIDEFFEGLPEQDKKVADVFEEPVTPVEGANKDEEPKPEKDDEPRKNRRHRRLEQQLAEEREARIRAEALIDARSEVDQFRKGVGDDEVDDRWLRIYGDTPEARQAWKLQLDILNDYKTQAKDEALQEVREQQEVSVRQQKEFESFIDGELESIEDEYGVDVTSDAPAARKARREFLEMVQQASPKDEDGTLTAYADFSSVWEFYQLKKGKDTGTASRNKDISSRTMAKSTGQGTTEQVITPGFNGWRQDYGI